MVPVSMKDVMITCVHERCSGVYVDEKSGAYYVSERRDDLFAGEGCGAFLLVRDGCYGAKNAVIDTKMWSW